MDIYATCRVCFANNVKMYKVINTPLQDLYEKLTNVKLSKWDKAVGVNILCAICYTHLHRCHVFQRAASRAESLLAQLYVDNEELTEDILSTVQRQPVFNYDTTTVEHIDIYCGDVRESEQIKLEETEKDDDIQHYIEDNNDVVDEISEITMKLEYESEAAAVTESGDNAASDSDEDVPLHVLRRTTVGGEGKQVAEGGRKRRYKECKVNAREVVLTDWQQKEAMSARALSHNYVRAPHRCSLCRRGFANSRTYDNHMEKHAESSGKYVCQLCFLRYRSPRLLRAHLHASHERSFICNKCGHTAHTRHQAKDHERVHSGDLYECKLCGKTFHARTSYLTHVRSSHPGAAHPACPTCGERFLSQHGLGMHRARAHPGNNRREACEEPPESRYCSSCDVQFESRRAWTTHVLATPAHVRAARRAKECPICAKAVEGSMEGHLASHEKERRRPRAEYTHRDTLNCDQCELRFLGAARLAAHVRTVHLGQKYNKNLVCEVCGKKCTSGASLRCHQRTHTGEKPHACGACGKRFADTGQLRVHARVHTGERPYACHHCGKTFTQKPALNRHYRVHTGAKPYTCEVCSKSFSQSNSLHNHVKAVHLKMAIPRKRRTGNKKNDADGLTSVKDLGE